MKFINKKQSQTGLLLFPTLAFVLALILFFLFTAPSIDDSIGKKQAAIIRTVGKGEQELSFVDTSARLAAWKSIFEIGDNGGFYSDIGDEPDVLTEEYPCDRFVYNLWNSKNSKCWPSSDEVKAALENYFDKNLKTVFFAQHPTNRFNRIIYNYEVESDATTKRTLIRGITQNSTPIRIVYEARVSEEVTLSRDVFIEDEPITECCDGVCVVGVADDYYNKYGPASAINLPYVWGGETPYDIDETQRKAENPDSFFHGVFVDDDQEGKGIPSVPGFDCSGFVWWVYKHAAIPDFKGRLTAMGYEEVAEKNGYEQICGPSSSQCTLQVMDNNAEPGDLLFKHNNPKASAGHIAIYAGNGYIYDSSSPRNGIDKRPLPQDWLQYLTVYRFPYNTGCVHEEQEVVRTSVTEIPKDAHDRIMFYDDIIQEEASKNKVPDTLIKAVIMQESRGDKDAVSCTGCAGIMQFCGPTARDSRFSGIFDNQITTCKCHTCKVGVGCASFSGCSPSNDNRFDPEKSIKAGALYLRILLKHFEDYAHKDAFAVASYNSGQGLVDKAIKKAKNAYSTNDPSWSQVFSQITPQLIYEVYCSGGDSTSYYCGPGSDEYRVAKVREVGTYVENVLNYYAAFGGGSISATSTYKGVKVSFTPTRIGYYYVNPSFTTEVDYNLGIYNGLSAWARKTYEVCSGSQKDLSECVEEEKKKHNDAVATTIAATVSSAFGVAPNNPNPLASNLLFLFKKPSDPLCDGDKDRGYYEFIETFEDCLDHKLPGCYCKFDKNLKFFKLKLSSEKIVLYDELNAVKDSYDFSDDKKFMLYHNNKEVDYMILKGEGLGKYYSLEYHYKNSDTVDKVSQRDNLYFVKNSEKLEDFVYNLDGLEKCDLKGSKHKFRFCAISPQMIPKYEKDKLRYREVAVKFALDLYDAPPPAIAPDSTEVDKPEDMLKQEKENVLTPEKECEGLGNANLKLTTSTKDLKPAYESFISNLVTKLVPELGVLLFVKNFFVTQNELPALITVELDLKGASEECDVVGLAYKCGLGVQPYKNGKFDFSNPTGYIDLSSRFNAQSSFSCDAPEACTFFTNPDGSLTEGKIRCAKPSISKDKNTISFSISKCTDPILQYKKMSGLDIITAALNGFGYYFAFAYVDGNGNYGPANIKSVEIPSIMNQLEEQLGLENLFLLKSVLLGNYEDLFGLLGFDDEFQFIRNALASASLDRILMNLEGQGADALYGEIAKHIKDEDAAKIVTDLAQDALNGKLDTDYAQELVNKLTDNLGDDEIDMVLEKLVEAGDTLDYVVDFLDKLPDDVKQELLEEIGEGVYEGTSGGVEVTGYAIGVVIHPENVDERWDEVMEDKDKVISIIKELNPADKLALFQHMAAEVPDQLLKAAVNTVSKNKIAETVREVLGEKNELARLIAYASPDYAKKAALDYFLNQFPEYRDLFNLFEDFGGVTC